ncbi:L,D-transpeptidase [Bradyrhizobium sp. 2TAF24]|uniref:L,D-transpeptidase n=1 Tax=Bradyrhizobium sp. 2TAF24 TaxID=3233011 RepID=UPI003F8DE226
MAGLLAAGLFGAAVPAGAGPLTPFPLLPLPLPIAPPIAMPAEPQATPQIEADADAVVAERPARFKRQIVAYQTRETQGTIVIDTSNTYLYYVLGGGRALRYGIGVGRQGFTWSGTQAITRKAEWPDWTPPAEMLARQPYLPRFVAGGPQNPLGARAMYLGGTAYRIHGTNNPSTIGGHVSSGCIRMTNDDVIDLYGRASVGTRVVVLPAERHASTATMPRG